MGRHIWFRTPTADDRKDIFDLYLARSTTTRTSTATERRDELARITNGYSPAMIEQVCSMALTLRALRRAHRVRVGDIVEAMTTIESGTAQGIDYVPEETRQWRSTRPATPSASHVYMQDVLSTRLSIRKRGGSLGHHQAIEKRGALLLLAPRGGRQARLDARRDGGRARLLRRELHRRRRRRAERDPRAAWMVGMCGDGPRADRPQRPALRPEEEREEAEEQFMKRFERIGPQIMNRAAGMRESGDPIAAVLSDPGKRRAAAQILGQAYITAVCLIRHNREQVLHIAETLIERRELHGDEVVDVLDAAGLQAPVIDLDDESIWPKL